MIVVDTNLIVLAAIDSDQSDAAERVLDIDADWVAPPLWRSELRSTLSSYMRQRRWSVDEAVAAFERADGLVVAEPLPGIREVMDLVSESPCTAYDLEFVALARDLDIPLITLARQLLSEFPGLAVSPRAFADANA